MRSMAADPVKKLVVPRLVATMVMLPALTVLGDLLGVLGGMTIAVVQLDLTASFYLNDVLASLTLDDVWSGVAKSFFFAIFITVVACRNGLTAEGGADGVGHATTRTVVLASILILITDFFLTKLFYLVE
jgi:phospholipid/cholesterol/gamma-HCH transport system permease protein